MAKVGVVYLRDVGAVKAGAKALLEDGDELRELERQGKAQRLTADEAAKLTPEAPPAPPAETQHVPPA